MIATTLLVLKRGLQSARPGEWAAKEDGFMHLAVYLSVVLVVLSVWETGGKK